MFGKKNFCNKNGTVLKIFKENIKIIITVFIRFRVVYKNQGCSSGNYNFEDLVIVFFLINISYPELNIWVYQ